LHRHIQPIHRSPLVLRLRPRASPLSLTQSFCTSGVLKRQRCTYCIVGDRATAPSKVDLRRHIAIPHHGPTYCFLFISWPELVTTLQTFPHVFEFVTWCQLSLATVLLRPEHWKWLRYRYVSLFYKGKIFFPWLYLFTDEPPKETYTWQSNGHCHDRCLSQYAFAIVQDNNCWCSDWIPSDQQDVRQCSDKCPGYPNELCGNGGKGLFGYIALSKQPSGTVAAATPTPSNDDTQQVSILLLPL
jgi:hypothetical protein